MDDFDKVIRFDDYGRLAWLWSNSTLHRDWTTNFQARFLIPPIYLNQYILCCDDNKMPVAYCSWAWMSRASEIKYLLDPSYLEPSSWNDGDRLWIIDFVSPFDLTNTKHLYQQVIHHFPNEHAHALRVKDDKEIAHVMSFTGANLDLDNRKAIKLRKFKEFKSLYLDREDFEGRFRTKNL